MKKLIFILLVLFPLIGLSQTFESKSRIKLTDGSELYLTIVENIIGDYIRIKLPGGEITKISYDKIESIKHDGFKYNSSYKLPKGFYLDAAFNFMLGRSSPEFGSRMGIAPAISANMRVNSFFSAGLGVETNYIMVNGENLFLPVYLHISGNFAEKRVAPMYFIDGGWVFPIYGEDEVTEAKGGWFIRPGVGIKINNVSLKLGYQTQKVTTINEQPDWWGMGRIIREEERILRNITIGASFSF